jgi:hypothetical protein
MTSRCSLARDKETQPCGEDTSESLVRGLEGAVSSHGRDSSGRCDLICSDSRESLLLDGVRRLALMDLVLN